MAADVKKKPALDVFLIRSVERNIPREPLYSVLLAEIWRGIPLRISKRVFFIRSVENGDP